MGADGHSLSATNTRNAAEIQTWLIQHIAGELGLDPVDVSPDAAFESFGMASRDAVMLSGDLEDWLNRSLSPTLLWEYPTITALANHLAGAVDNAAQTAHGTRPADAHEPIAIVGIACRFPGAGTPEALWRLLENGVDAITEVPTERWSIDEYYDARPGTPGKMCTKWGGFLEQVDRFDPQFFGISPREAVRMDPQQRLLLETSWEALERAGIAPDGLAGSHTGVFVGISTADYAQLQFGETQRIDAYAGSGNALSIAANRVSYTLDLRGPSVALDTACSSSLVAVHWACRSLLSGECSLALAGGVNLTLAPETTITFSQARMMALDGRCKTFDARADGYVRGEGCGVVALKRLSDAVRDGDPIIAVIRGTAINHDGRSNGLTAPNGLAQQAVVRQALENAGVAPADISYVEAHGTGTSLGDPIEVESLKAVLLEGRNANQRCALGSIKTNIGHLESAAGIAGLIKVALSLWHESIPPHLHLRTLNPLIALDSTPFWIPTEPTPWTKTATPRRAGVSAFGFGGANAHAILEEAPAPAASLPATGPAHAVLCLSAQNAGALDAATHAFADALTEHTDLDLGAVCCAAATGRTHFGHRRAAIASDTHALKEALAHSLSGETTPNAVSGTVSSGAAPKIAFLFTGQGAQYPGMGRRLYKSEPVFRDALDTCASILKPLLNTPLLDILFAPPESATAIHHTANSQPALFALEYALAELWRSWGVVPDVVIGHSVGEYAAACVAGAFSLEDGLALIARRAQLMQALPANGAMLAVFATPELANNAIQPYEGRIAVAAINGLEHVVVSGDAGAIAALADHFARENVATRPLTVSHAFHSPLLDPMLDDLERAAEGIRMTPIRIPLVANRSGALLEPGATLDAHYWRRHARETVQFQQSMQTASGYGCTTFVELGPHPVLAGMGARCVPADNKVWIPSLKREHDDSATVAHALAQLYVRGVNINWLAYYRGRRPHVSLPTYPFQRQRYWFDTESFGRRTMTPSSGADTLVQVDAVPDDCRYTMHWRRGDRPSAVIDHAANAAWIVFADAGGVAESVAAQLESHGGRCILVDYAGSVRTGKSNRISIHAEQADDYVRVIAEYVGAAQSKIRGALHFWSLDVPSQGNAGAEVFEVGRQLSCESALHALHALAAVQTSDHPKLWVITRKTQPAGETPAELTLAQSPVWGLGRSAALELPHVWAGLIDIDDAADVNALCAEFAVPDGEDQIALRGSGRYVARLAPQPAPPSSPNVFRRDGTYLITGGMGDLGVMVARWMVSKGARRIVLLGRTPAPARSDWDSPQDDRSKRIAGAIRELETQGASVITVQADVTDKTRMTAVFAELAQTLPAIRGIVHAAGAIQPVLFRELTAQTLHSALHPKVDGAWNLHELSLGLPLDFFVMFSSIASAWGSKGLAHYAAANHFLDTLAHHRRALGLPGVSVNWGPWEGSSGEAAHHAALARMGLSPLEPAAGLALLGEAVASSQPQQIAALVDWDVFKRVYEFAGPRPLLAAFEAARNDEKRSNGSSSDALARLLAAPHDRQKYVLEEYLQVQIGRVLQLNASHVSVTQDLMSLGLDSLMIMEVIADLSKDFKIKLYPREVFERPTIEALSEYIALEFGRENHGAAHEPVTMEPDQSKVRSSRQGAWRQPEQKIPGIVFLLSSPRSGSTLLRVMLAGHPDLFCPPELHLLPFSSMREREDTLGATYLGEGLLRAVMELNACDASEAGALVGRLVEQDTPIQDVYALLQQRAGARQLVDKSPTYATARENLDHAEAAFDGAKYIHLARHPYAVIESFVRTRMEKMLGLSSGNPFVLAEQIWAESNRNTVEFAAGIDPARYHRVLYENLVADPRGETVRLCAFLGIPFHEALLHPYEGKRMTEGVHAQSLAIGDPNFANHSGIDASLGDAWKSVRAPRSLAPSTLQLAADLGYELRRESSASNAFAEPFAAIEEGRL